VVNDGAKNQQPDRTCEDANCAKDKMDAIFHTSPYPERAVAASDIL
jgi:hypothetical protein